MSRLCPTLILGCGIALAGCSGQNLHGRWAGKWPYDDAKDCRTQIFPNGAFELVCWQNSWVGVGRYTREDSSLRFTFEALTHKQEVVKDPQPMEMRIVEEAGNRISLQPKGYDIKLEWQRRMPSEDQQ